jgi:hypothetical protein
MGKLSLCGRPDALKSCEAITNFAAAAVGLLVAAADDSEFSSNLVAGIGSCRPPAHETKRCRLSPSFGT